MRSEKILTYYSFTRARVSKVRVLCSWSEGSKLIGMRQKMGFVLPERGVERRKEVSKRSEQLLQLRSENIIADILFAPQLYIIVALKVCFWPKTSTARTLLWALMPFQTLITACSHAYQVQGD